MTGKIYHPEDKHPQPYQQDLNPDANVGQGHGGTPDPAGDNPPTAFDRKEAHPLLRGFSDDELRRIVILPRGSRLEAGATYLDLHDPARGEFTGRADHEVGDGEWIVPKSRVDYPLWNRLIVVTDAERLDRPS